ncbi:hypothetical protein CDL15_Pgr000204 [Punica granatum]|uniref:Uncharacterized protein n=1 Tax=Punica granatum TaxID=22663 RepID=A0A218Y2D0_PUNGR|nr:hypothetical protein CDL15_Pgr000204 [Punica granatum]
MLMVTERTEIAAKGRTKGRQGNGVNGGGNGYRGHGGGFYGGHGGYGYGQGSNSSRSSGYGSGKGTSNQFNANFGGEGRQIGWSGPGQNFNRTRDT